MNKLSVLMGGGLALSLLLCSSASSHTGQTASDGCHYCRTNCDKWGVSHGQRHCHSSLNKNLMKKGQQHSNANISKVSVSEDYCNMQYCDSINGKTEVKHFYDYEHGSSYVLVDCETDKEVIEGGLDKRSSLDSVQQAVFFAMLTRKQPIVVIYNTDLKEGKYEYRIKSVANAMGIEYRNPICKI